MADKPRIHWAWQDGYTYPPSPLVIADCDHLTEFASVSLPKNGFFICQFNSPCQIEALRVRFDVYLRSDISIADQNEQRRFYFYVSNEETPSPPATSPDWVPIAVGTYDWNQRYQEMPCAIEDCKWLAFTCVDGSFTVYCAHAFGDYIDPRFEFWDVLESEILNTSDIPFIMPNAPSAEDYHEYLSFKIKNTDTVTHDYSLTVKPVRFNGDTVINDNFKLGKQSDGYIKSGTITLSGLTADSFSEELRVFGDIATIDNPADWLHYFVIDASETSPDVLNLYSIYGLLFLYDNLKIGESIFGKIGLEAGTKTGESAFGSVRCTNSLKTGDSIYGQIYLGGNIVCGIANSGY